MGHRPRPHGVHVATLFMDKPTKLKSSGSTPHFGARMSSYAWLGVVLAKWAGRVDHPASPPTSQHGTLSDFWPMATMATMATLGARPLKNIALREYWLVGYHPHSSLLFYFQVSI